MNKSMAQVLGPILGLVYLLVGVAGFFVTGFDGLTADGNDALLGFSINPFHNIVHLGAGLFLIIMCTAFSAPVAEGAVMGSGLFLIVAFVIGVTGGANLTILSMNGAGDLENINHVVVGVTLLVLGLLSSAATQANMRKRGLVA